MPTILRFETNVPIELTLENDAGVTVAGRYGDRVMYTLNDSRRIYVAPFVARRISELGIRAGEPFKICKRYVKTGQRKTVDWLVERPDADGETQLERDLRDSIDIAKLRNESSASGPPPPPARPMIVIRRPSIEASDPPPWAPTEETGSTNGHHSSSTVLAPGSGSQPPPDTQLAHALKTAIAAAVEAEKFAKTLDYNIRFTTDDVRSMGITILIGMQQRVR